MATGSANPFKHPYPHSKLRNVKLTSIVRLTKGDMSKIKMISNEDVRNFAISRADEVAQLYGWRAQ